MAEQAYAYVTLIPVAKGFQGAIAKEMAGVSNVGKQAGEGAGNKFTSGFGSVMKGLAIAGTAAVGIAAAGIGVAMNKGFERLTNIENARNLLQGIGHDAATVDQVMSDALASVKGTAFGLGDAAKVAAGAVAAGIEPGEALERQLKVIADTAAVAGTSLDDIGAIMGKVTTTNKASNRELQQLAERGIPVYQMLADQIGVTGEEIFDMASKGQISAEMLETALSDNIGGAALKAGETTEGAFANLNASIGRVGANLMGGVFAQLPGFFMGLTDALGPVEEIAAELGATIGEKMEPVFAALVDLVPTLVDALLPLIPVLLDIGVALIDAFIAILPILIDFISSLIPIVAALLPPFLELLPIIVELAEAVLPLFAQLIAELAPLIAELAPIVIALIQTALAILIPIFLQLAQALMPLVQQLLPIILELMVAFAPLVLALIEAFLPLIELVLPILIGLIEWLIPILITIAEIIGFVVVEAVGLLVAAIEWLTEKWGAFGVFFEELWNNIRSFFVEIINGIITIFEGMINAVIRGLNWLIDQINKIKFDIPDLRIFGDLRGKSFGFSFANIAQVSLDRIALAEGGFVDQPTEALIGEAGPEVVMPLDRFERIMGLDEARENKVVNYYAAPNQSLTAEQELMKAMRRARLVAQW